MAALFASPNSAASGSPQPRLPDVKHQDEDDTPSFVGTTVTAGGADDDLCSSGFTYSWLKDVVTLGPHRPKSINVKQQHLDAMTGMERQFWEIKAPNFDVVIFFKKGKFYELYDCDAVVANREFGLKMAGDSSNRGKMRMSGVPEQSFAEWSRLFIFRGYKVGRVEQMVIDEEMVRANGGKPPSVMPRELVQILTRGTVTDGKMLAGESSNFIVSVAPPTNIDSPSKKKHRTEGESLSSATSGWWADVVAVDLSRGVYFHCPCPEASAFPALLHQLSPVELVLPSARMCIGDIDLEAVITGILPEAAVEYAPAPSGQKKGRALDATSESPAWGLLAIYLENLKLDVGRLLPPVSDNAGDASLRFVDYRDHWTTSAELGDSRVSAAKAQGLLARDRRSTGLIIDAAAMESLELTANLRDGGKRGTLLETISGGGKLTRTPGGQRLLRQWVLRPCSDAAVIRARQAIVVALRTSGVLHEVWQSVFGKSSSTEIGSPKAGGSALASSDFERLLSRVSELAHEDARVSFADPLVLYAKHLGTLLTIVGAFQQLSKLAESLLDVIDDPVAEDGVKPAGASLLRELLEPMVATKSAVNRVVDEFNLTRRAVEQGEGFLIPRKGLCAAYDEACATMDQCEEMLKKGREDLCTKLRNNTLKFVEIGTEYFVVEMPSALAEKVSKSPGEFGLKKDDIKERQRTQKTVKCAVTSFQPTITKWKDAKTARENSLVQVLRDIAKKLVAHWSSLYSAAQNIAYLDALAALAALADQHCCVGAVCLPEFPSAPGLRESQQLAQSQVSNDHAVGFVELKGAYHPAVLALSGRVVANDVTLGRAASPGDDRVLLLTGPNMGGKSTLMRALAANVIVSQLGGFAWADKFHVSGNTFDRIFTRIGARDATHRGFSTLRVELEEMASVHRCATGRSLCLVDELGRGTATHDGFAIAHASLCALASPKLPGSLPPLSIFSTHYHGLALEFSRASAKQHQPIQPGYMDFRLVDSASPHESPSKKDEATPMTSKRVEFLYRLVPGVCSRSYGVEVAAKAGLPSSVVATAREMSDRMQTASTDAQLLRWARGLVDLRDEDSAVRDRARQLVALLDHTSV